MILRRRLSTGWDLSCAYILLDELFLLSDVSASFVPDFIWQTLASWGLVGYSSLIISCRASIEHLIVDLVDSVHSVTQSSTAVVGFWFNNLLAGLHALAAHRFYTGTRTGVLHFNVAWQDDTWYTRCSSGWGTWDALCGKMWQILLLDSRRISLIILVLSWRSSVHIWRVLVLRTVGIGWDFYSWQVIQNTWNLSLGVSAYCKNFLTLFWWICSRSVCEEIILMMLNLTIRNIIYLGSSGWYKRLRRVSWINVVVVWSF